MFRPVTPNKHHHSSALDITGSALIRYDNYYTRVLSSPSNRTRVDYAVRGGGGGGVRGIFFSRKMRFNKTADEEYDRYFLKKRPAENGNENSKKMETA